ncbi:MAG: DUF126 domain-containing protein [Anderseniella sp.]
MKLAGSKVLFEGIADGVVLRLDAPLSFWGGFDPATGIIIDNNHPQKGECLQGKVLVMPATRGSGGTPGGVAESIRNRSGPAAIIMRTGDQNVMIGAAVAKKLYGLTCPVLEISGAEFEELQKAERAHIAMDGTITIAYP